jgi:hypothetical protein
LLLPWISGYGWVAAGMGAYFVVGSEQPGDGLQTCSKAAQLGIRPLKFLLLYTTDASHSPPSALPLATGDRWVASPGCDCEYVNNYIRFSGRSSSIC